MTRKGGDLFWLQWCTALYPLFISLHLIQFLLHHNFSFGHDNVKSRWITLCPRVGPRKTGKMAAGRQQGGVRIIPFISSLGWSSATSYCFWFFLVIFGMMIRLIGPSLLEMQRRRRQTPFFRNRIDIVEEGLYRDKDRKDMRKKKIKNTSQGKKFDSGIQECRRRSFKLRA